MCGIWGGLQKMGSTLWWVLDVLVVFLTIHVIVSNAKRGLTKVIILCIGYIAVTLIASLLAAMGAPVLYDQIAAQTNLTALENANKRTDFAEIFTQALQSQNYGVNVDEKIVEQSLVNTETIPFDQSLYEYLNQMNGESVCDFTDFQAMLCLSFVKGYSENLSERMPKYVKMNFEKEYVDNLIGMREFMQIWYSNALNHSEKTAKIETLLCAEPTREVLQIFLYFILFSIFMVIVAIISAIAQNSLFFNVTNATEHFVGGVLGILEAGAMLVLLTLLIRLIIMLSGNSLSIINEDAVHESYLFSHLYNNISKLL